MTERRAVRIVCLDSSDRVLLLHWQDPFSGARLWEPPGGGIEDGESPIEAARRELTEETGLDPAAMLDHGLLVQRDFVWNSTRFVGKEVFFLVRFSSQCPHLSAAGMLADEHPNFREYGWFDLEELSVLTGLEPPHLHDVIAELVA